MTDVLKIRGLTSGYDGSTVLDGVDLSVPAGGVLALLGRNGVGKTTLISTLMGLIRPTAGSVTYRGVDYAGKRPEQIARAGAALVPQGRRLFSALTVEEHLKIASRGRPGPWNRERVIELLPRLGERLGHRAGQLSGGEAQMVAIARALLQNPDLLLLDEPSDGLAPGVVAQVGEVVKEVCGSGMTVLIVEQDLRLAFSVADRVAVMEKGRVVLDTTAHDFRSDRTRAHALLGIG